MQTHNLITFDSRDLDRSFWEKRASREAELIYRNPNSRRNRSLDQIVKACMQGQAAETWLISKGYFDDPRPYRDLFRPDRVTPIEVKVSAWDPRYILERYAERLRSWSTSDLAKLVYVFHNKEPDTIFTFRGIFEWDPPNNRYIGTPPQL